MKEVFKIGLFTFPADYASRFYILNSVLKRVERSFIPNFTDPTSVITLFDYTNQRYRMWENRDDAEAFALVNAAGDVIHNEALLKSIDELISWSFESNG